MFQQRVEPYLSANGLRYITQTNRVWNVDNMYEGTWVTRIGRKGVVYLGLTQDTFHLADEDVYVVLWNKRFQSKLQCIYSWFVVDFILLQLLEGQTRPKWLCRILAAIQI